MKLRGENILMGVKMLVIGSFLVFDLSFYHFDLSFCVLFQFLRFFLISVFAILLKKKPARTTLVITWGPC